MRLLGGGSLSRRKGRFALVLNGAATGDLVCIVAGASAPLVLQHFVQSVAGRGRRNYIATNRNTSIRSHAP
jgi:hypothetical protein